MSTDTQDLLLALCDISGYTRFMLAHGEALRHAFVVVTQLMEAMVREVRPPLEVAKLEGDAVFLYALQRDAPAARARLAAEMIQQLDNLFAAFNARRTELIEANICPCGGCRNADQLCLKIVVHSGAALFHRVGKFEELAGPDVILAHRLLKNSLPQSEYVLLTEAARRELGGEPFPREKEAEEVYDDFGTVRVFACEPPLGSDAAMPAVAPGTYASFSARAKDTLIKIVQSRLMQVGLKRRPAFRHLPPVAEASPSG